MFAGKFRSWMEAHLGRPRKNKQHKKDNAKAGSGQGPGQGLARGLVDSMGPCAGAGPGGRLGGGPGGGRQESPTLLTDLPASSHLHRGPLTAESLDSISTCPTTGSERGGSLRPHVNLSSPESAYSTGYSTDGTSPGASFPPEYYINLRTGTHYFQSQLPAGLPLHLPAGGPGPASLPLPLPGGPPPGAGGPGLPLHLPPGLPPLPPALQPALQQQHLATLHTRQTWAWPTGLVQQAEPPPPRLSYLTPGRSRKQQHQHQQHQQLLLEQQQQQLHYLQQQHQHQQQLLQQQQQLYQKQQQQQQYLHALSRTESSTEEDLVGKARPTSASSSTISSHSAASSARPSQHWQPSECVASPRARERTRIRTNPWLPTSPAPTPTATPTPRTRNQQPPTPQQPQQPGRQGLGGCSSSLSLSSSSSYGSASDVSLQRRPGRTRARPQPLFQLNEESPSVEDKPLPRAQAQPSPRRGSPAAPAAATVSCVSISGRISRAANRVTGRPAVRAAPPGRSSSGSSTSSASSRTANNGSPPNFSDNENNEEDVTLNEMMGKFDESYVYEKETDILSDSDPTDVEDYGDDGGDEQTEEDRADDELDFIDRGSLTEICDDGRGLAVNRGHCTYHNFPPGRRLSSRQRGSRREGGGHGAPAGPRSRTPSDRRRKRAASARPRPSTNTQESEMAAGTNLNRIVMHRLLLHGEAQGVAGTRSAGSTPISARRGDRRVPQPQPPQQHRAQCALAEADREADRKYRQLIMQAEHILVSMSGSPLPVRAPHYGTPPMAKRLPIGHLNRRLDYLKQGASPPPAKHVMMGRPLCPSPLARRECERAVVNDNAEENRNRWSPHVMPRRAMEDRCYTPSPTNFRRAETDNGYLMDSCRSPNHTPTPTPPPEASPMSTPGGRRRGPPPVPPPRTISVPKPSPASIPPTKEPEPRMNKPFELKLKPLPPKGWTAIEASSSDSDGSVTPHFLDRRAKSTATTPTSTRPPLVTYKSVDHRLDSIDTCPQSEPVKRKVYAGSHTLDRLSKKLENTQIMPRTPTTPVPDDEEERRRDVLMQTLQQLKQSLESQSASLQVPG